ncbi:RNA polymerase sigma factor [Neiella marina]|uniref:RNA polymerase sigma factor n=1 Tax=Neiella marina TaxID=508461 RepID=A0A8J2U2Z9_9GAMM|nr:RNA polymerase sigma factor [Neiella marina]GGA68279.1 RNA polymerase sigma factor [Neiella marina]
MIESDVGDNTESTPVNMDEFLQAIEVKAYRIALFAVGEHADALDIIQDSMIKLVTNYQQRAATEWKPLFYRILQNRITDFHRKRKVRSFVQLFNFGSSREEPVEPPDSEPHPDSVPQLAWQKQQQQQAVFKVLNDLPLKQQQCFLLRSWEGMSVAETAAAMDCSPGTVKTHYFRATTKIRELLEQQYDIHI